VHSTAFAATIELYNLFSDDYSSISLNYLLSGFSDVEEDESSDTENEGNEGEEHEQEDADEKEYCAIYRLNDCESAHLIFLKGHYILNEYSVDLKITVQPPEHDK